jgi:Autoinducer binding domain
MPTWIESSLKEAASALDQIGSSELAAILDRLRHEPEVQDLRLYRSLHVADLADALHECESLDELLLLIKRIAAAFGVSHCTIHCIRERTTAFFGTKVLSTFPREWLAEYVERRYTAIDPIVARCRSQTGTFFWDELVITAPMTKHFIKSSNQAGIGPSGVSVVQQASNGSTVGVTLCSTADQETFRSHFEPQLSDFEEIAAIIVAVFCELACEHNQAPFNPTDDQLKVLRALACGHSMAEVEAFRFLYGSFRTIEKSILKSFGAKTLAHATAIAASMSLLDDLPYFEEDVFAVRPEFAALKDLATAA